MGGLNYRNLFLSVLETEVKDQGDGRLIPSEAAKEHLSQLPPAPSPQLLRLGWQSLVLLRSIPLMDLCLHLHAVFSPGTCLRPDFPFYKITNHTPP